MASEYDAEDFESELILLPQIRELHTELIRENLKVQIGHPFETKTDFVEAFNQQCEDAWNEGEYSEEDNKQVNIVRTDFYLEVIKLISDKFHLDVDTDTISNFTTDEVDDICTALYNFFILKRKKNIKNMMINYIITHKGNLITTLEYLKSKKDVTSNSNKSKIKDENMALIVSNIQDVIRYIMSLDINMEDMVEYINLENFNNLKVKELINDGIIRGDFQVFYFMPLHSFQDKHYDEIMSKITNGLIKTIRRN